MPLAANLKANARTGLMAKLGRGRFDPKAAAKIRPAEPRSERALYLRYVNSLFELWGHFVFDRLEIRRADTRSGRARRWDAGPLLSTDWAELVDRSGLNGLLDRIAVSIADRNQTYFDKVVKTPVPKIGAQASMVEDFRTRNIGLIKNLGDTQVSDVNSILSKGNAAGLRHEEIAGQIQEKLGVGRSRAKLIARDQTLKYNSSVHTAQAQAAGIEKFRWSTSHDAAVRPTHKALDGTIHAYSDPPVTNEDGDRNLPGEDYQCRCAAIPIIDAFADIDEEPDAFDPGLLPERPDPLQAKVNEIGVVNTDYLKSGMRPESLGFARTIYQGTTPEQANAIARGLPEPIRLEISPDRGRDKIVLGDGRHRMTAAIEAGATEINAKVVKYGPRGGVRSVFTGPVKLR